MARLSFTGNLMRHVDCPSLELADAFARAPQLRGCVLDDQGALRKHVVAAAPSRSRAKACRSATPAT
jgi:hypothetical protein